MSLVCNQTSVIRVQSHEDPRLDRYRQLKGSRQSRRQDVFVCEGRFAVQRLITSGMEIESLLISDRCPDEFMAFLRSATFATDAVQVLSVSHEVCQSLVGFPFHCGIMAAGRRPRLRRVSLDGLADLAGSVLVCCPHISLTENLGAIVRNSAAFGAAGVIVGPQSVDPYSRRAIRVSMGTCFGLPIYEPDALDAELRNLQQAGFEILATSPSPEAMDVQKYQPASKAVLLLGHEATGLESHWIGMANRLIRIPMAAGVDSLNVATSAAIFLYELTKASDCGD